jgi:hypothetical protein
MRPLWSCTKYERNEMHQLFWVHEHKPDHGHPNSDHHDDDCADDIPAHHGETQREGRPIET